MLLLALELLALAAVGFVVARTALREGDDLAALAQGLVIGPALWGLAVSFMLRVAPGLAGAIVGWALILAIGVGLAWRSPGRLRVPRRRLAGFAGAALALFWVTLAARQLMKVPDPELHLGLAAYIRGRRLAADRFLESRLRPLLSPRRRRAGRAAGAAVGTESCVHDRAARGLPVDQLRPRRDNRDPQPRGLAQHAHALAVAAYRRRVDARRDRRKPHPQYPAGSHSGRSTGSGVAQLACRLMWPEPPPAWPSEFSGAPSEYLEAALRFGLCAGIHRASACNGQRPPVAHERAHTCSVGRIPRHRERGSRVIDLGLWVILDTGRIISLPMDRRTAQAGLLSAAAGPGAATLLLAICGSVLTGILADAPRAELSLRWITDPWSRQTLGRFDLLPGGLGLLGVGAVSTAAIAVLLARRDRLVLALTAGSVPLMIGALTLKYEPMQFDVTRFDGHARNFALLALLVALASRMPTLRRRWHIGVCA